MIFILGKCIQGYAFTTLLPPKAAASVVPCPICFLLRHRKEKNRRVNKWGQKQNVSSANRLAWQRVIFFLDLAVRGWKRGGFLDFFQNNIRVELLLFCIFLFIFLDIWQNLVPGGWYGYEIWRHTKTRSSHLRCFVCLFFPRFWVENLLTSPESSKIYNYNVN